MAVKHYYCGKVCFNCIITVQNIKTYFNQSHKLLAIHTFLQYKFGHTVSETSLELQQFCLLLLHCETYYIISGLAYLGYSCIAIDFCKYPNLVKLLIMMHVHNQNTYSILKLYPKTISVSRLVKSNQKAKFINLFKSSEAIFPNNKVLFLLFCD